MAIWVGTEKDVEDVDLPLHPEEWGFLYGVYFSLFIILPIAIMMALDHFNLIDLMLYPPTIGLILMVIALSMLLYSKRYKNIEIG